MKTSPAIAAFIAAARKYVGYTSGLLGRNEFGLTVGYDSTVWSGSFIDVVARESGVDLPSFTYSPAGLAESIRRGNISRTARVGDIAIFNFASASGHTASAFNAPHCGIVIDVRELKTNGRFLTIEGNVTGSTSHQQQDGVHQKIRYVTDVVVFCRPALKKDGEHLLTKLYKKFTGRAPGKLELSEIQQAASIQEAVHLKMIRGNTRNRSIELVQLALSQVTDLTNCERGKWDGSTQAAFASFQRSIGRVGSEATGEPDLNSLTRLSTKTGIFKVDN